MVDACLANGDLDGAVAVFREMKQALPDFSRGAVVFSAFVKACVQRKLKNLQQESTMKSRTCALAAKSTTTLSSVPLSVKENLVVFDQVDKDALAHNKLLSKVGPPTWSVS